MPPKALAIAAGSRVTVVDQGQQQQHACMHSIQAPCRLAVIQALACSSRLYPPIHISKYRGATHKQPFSQTANKQRLARPDKDLLALLDAAFQGVHRHAKLAGLAPHVFKARVGPCAIIACTNVLCFASIHIRFPSKIIVSIVMQRAYYTLHLGTGGQESDSACV